DRVDLRPDGPGLLKYRSDNARVHLLISSQCHGRQRSRPVSLPALQHANAALHEVAHLAIAVHPRRLMVNVHDLGHMVTVARVERPHPVSPRTCVAGVPWRLTTDGR